jgi:hypothetical protein
MNQDNYFAITNYGNNRADISITGYLTLDREKLARYTVGVIAMDGGSSSKTINTGYNLSISEKMFF